MSVLEASGRREDYPALDIEGYMSGTSGTSTGPAGWNVTYLRSPQPVVVTGISSDDSMVVVRVAFHVLPSTGLTEVYVGPSRIPVSEVDVISRIGNKFVAEVKFFLTSNDVFVPEPNHWSFRLALPHGVDILSFVSKESDIRYVCGLTLDPVAVAQEVSCCSFSLVWPTGSGENTVTINSKNVDVSGNYLKVKALPDTSYTCRLNNGDSEFEVVVETPPESRESLSRHYRSCRINDAESRSYDLTGTDPGYVTSLRKLGIIKTGDVVKLKDASEKGYVELTALKNGCSFKDNGSFYIIPSFDTDSEEWVCFENDSGSHLISFDRTEEFVRYSGVNYSCGEAFNIGSKTLDVIKGSIILVVRDVSLQEFPGGALTAARVGSSGDVVIRDLIMRSSHQIAPKVSGEYTYGRSSYYVYDASNNTTCEASRISHGVNDPGTEGSVSVDLLYTESSGGKTMHRALEILPSGTTISSVDSSGTLNTTFDSTGLRFNSDTGDVYFGASQDFRIHYEASSGNDPSTLQIQSYDSSSDSYVTRSLITNGTS